MSFRVSILSWLGWVMNLAGFPGWVRECSYRSHLGVQVDVRISFLFTVVTVNGVDIYFYRLSGQIDGVGFSPTDCRLESALQLVGPAAPPDDSRPRTHTRTPSVPGC